MANIEFAKTCHVTESNICKVTLVPGSYSVQFFVHPVDGKEHFLPSFGSSNQNELVELCKVPEDAVPVHGWEHFLHVQFKKSHGGEIKIKGEDFVLTADKAGNTRRGEYKVIRDEPLCFLEHKGHATADEAAPRT